MNILHPTILHTIGRIGRQYAQDALRAYLINRAAQWSLKAFKRLAERLLSNRSN